MANTVAGAIEADSGVMAIAIADIVVVAVNVAADHATIAGAAVGAVIAANATAYVRPQLCNSVTLPLIATASVALFFQH